MKANIGSLIPVVSLSAGILFSDVSGSGWAWGLVPVAIAIAIYLFIQSRSTDPMATLRLSSLHYGWIVMLFAGIGMITQALHRPDTIENAFKGNVPEYVLVEAEKVNAMTYGDVIEAEIESTNGAKCRLTFPPSSIVPGDLLFVRTSALRSVDSDTSSYVRSIAPVLRSKGCLYTGRVHKSGFIQTGHTNSLTTKSLEIRNSIEASVERSHLSKETAAFLSALLVGDKTGLGYDTRMIFANGGIAHILALSGLHMAIIAGFVLWLMFPLRLMGKYKWGYLCAIPILWMYVSLTGLSPSATRACLMITFSFIAVAMERRKGIGHSLCTACLLILIVAPAQLFDAGFQLSVVCVGALLTFTGTLNPMQQRQHYRLYRICEAIIATIVATAASWALTSYYFGQIPTMFLLANLLLLPLLPIYICLGVIFTCLLCFGIEVHIIGIVLTKGYEFMLWFAEWVSGGTDSVVEFRMPLWGVVSWYALLVATAIYIHRKKIFYAS